MKATSKLWNAPNKGSTNCSGFTGLPNGLVCEGTFYGQGNYCWLWTSAFYDKTYPIQPCLRLDINAESNLLYGSYKHYGFIVRCVKD